MGAYGDGWQLPQGAGRLGPSILCFVELLWNTCVLNKGKVLAPFIQEI